MGSTQGKAQKMEKEEEEKCFIFKEMVKKSMVSSPEAHYKFLERIGEGNYSEVYKVQSLSTGQMRVIKKVQRNTSPTVGRHLFNQFQILREIDHPNIIKMFQMFQDEKYHYIVTEHLPGKDALDLLISLKTFQEPMAFNLVYQCLLALNYLHKNKVMHRDIKLENIIYDEETLCFKLIDFGSALRFTSYAPQERRSTGTIHYMAPEVINKFYNMKCDVWSLGILLYVLMSGNAPFSGQSHESIIQKTLKAPLSFNKPVWETRSQEVKSLISRMLQKNLQKRPCVSEILKDPWILNNKGMRQLHKCEVESICIALERLMRFRKIKFTDIQLGILLFMLNFILKVQNEIALIRTFLKIDQLEDGEIDEKELAQGLMDYLRMDRKNAENGAREIMQKIDLDGSGNISFSQFTLGATDLRKVITHQNISQTFKYIDTDNSQKISMAELQARLGDHLDAAQYQKLVGLFDSDNDGEIDFCEFSKMMTDLLKQY